MNVLQELANWAKTLPPWQSDAVRRLFTQDELSVDDEAELYAMLLAAHGLTDPGTTVVTPSPFSNIVDAAQPTNRTVLLKEIHTLDNVNALVPGQSLKFGLDGLTVIYGENGAGKSGYARVFKHACHAREKSEPILTDVSKPATTRPAATVELLVDDQHVAVRWKAGAPASELLSEIAVFDSHCARVFIDEANEVVYLPYGLDTFSRLAALCTSLKNRITSELTKVPLRFDQAGEYADATVAGRFVRTLAATSDEKEIDVLTSLTEKAVARLDELRTIVATAKTNSPKLKAAELRRVKTRFVQLKTSITTIAAALSPELLVRLARLQSAAEAARKAADLASTEAFPDDPLKTTGSDPWRVLFEAARSFSQSSAYPNEEFPVVRDGAVCLLCQQPLTDLAGQRLGRFEQFIKDNAARRRDEAVTALGNATKAVLDVKLTVVDDDPALLEEVRAHEPTLADRVAAFFLQSKTAKQAITSAIAENKPVPSITTLENPVVQIDAAIASLEAEAQQYESADNLEEFKKLTDELADLEDRARLKRHADLLRKFIGLKKREAGLKKCEKALDTSAITRRSSELMEQVVTERLRTSLTSEVQRLGLLSAPVQIKKVGQKGKTKLQLFVSDASKPSGILSEGEQRIIAISSFLAELKAGNSRAPIVFDDPVSSLDHRFREKVAHRLVAESKTRQVIVFTHDVVLLLALEREAAEQQIPLLIQTVSRSPAGPGECIPTVPRPWYACSTRERLSQLKNEIAPYKKLQAESPDEYRRRVAGFYGKLRETWERAVEEVLLQDVIQRFRPSIETQRLKRVTIDQADYIAIEAGMAKCSTWMTGHDSAGAIGSPPPNHDELANDLKSLEDFTKVLTDRATKAGKAMGVLIEAPAAKVSDMRAETVVDLTIAATERTSA
jgi:energy-coupling factor transporter ATP-binding protein EcfA2